MHPPSPLLSRMSPHRGQEATLFVAHFAVIFSLVGVNERRDTSSRTSDNGNAMSRTADIRNVSSRTSDNGECLVSGGGQAGIRRGGRLGPDSCQGGGDSSRAAHNGKTSAQTADGRRQRGLEHIYYILK